MALFENNYRDGDFATIESRLSITEVREKMHSVCMDLQDVCKANRTSAAGGCLLWIYENTPCSMCRLYAVEMLVDMHLLPERLKEECLHDCSEDIRNLVSRINDKSGFMA